MVRKHNGPGVARPALRWQKSICPLSTGSYLLPLYVAVCSQGQKRPYVWTDMLVESFRPGAEAVALVLMRCLWPADDELSRPKRCSAARQGGICTLPIIPAPQARNWSTYPQLCESSRLRYARCVRKAARRQQHQRTLITPCATNIQIVLKSTVPSCALVSTLLLCPASLTCLCIHCQHSYSSSRQAHRVHGVKHKQVSKSASRTE
jgi:hypothetical protein